MGEKKKRPPLGILDILDITIGRVSDSDSTQPGKRKRSWGATMMLFFAIPAFTLVGAVAFSVVYSSVRTPTTVAAGAVKRTTARKGKKTKPVRTPQAGKLPNYIDWPIICLAGLLLCVGVAFALIRREQDLHRALKIGNMAAQIKNGSSGTVSGETHSFLESTIQSVVGKVTGHPPEKPESLPAADEPQIEEPDEWAERRKQQGGT